MLERQRSSSDLPWGESGEGEGVTVRHGGCGRKLLEV